MKNLFALIGLITFLGAGTLFAQGPGPENQSAEKRKEAQELRKKYFNRALQLTDEESKVFWPIMDAHDAKLKALRKEKKKPRLELMSDAEIEAYIDTHLDDEMKMLEAKRALFTELKGKLSPRKIAMIPQAEKNFRRDLLNRYKRNRGEHQRGGRQGGPRKRLP